MKLTDFFGVVVPQEDVARHHHGTILTRAPPPRQVGMWRQQAVMHGNAENTSVILVGWIGREQYAMLEKGSTYATETYDVEYGVTARSAIRPLVPHKFEEEDVEALEEETIKLGVEIDNYNLISTRFVTLDSQLNLGLLPS